MLDELNESKIEIEKKLAKMPLVQQAISSIKWKNDLEQKLETLMEAINKLSSKKLIYIDVDNSDEMSAMSSF